MRIALIYDAIYPYEIGGVEHRNYALAAALRDRNEVSLYGFEHWRDDPNRRLERVNYVSVGLPTPRYDRAGRRRSAEAIAFAFGLGWALLRARETVWDVANFPYLSVPVAWLVSRFRRRTLVVTWHEYWGDYWREYSGGRGWLGQLVERLALWCSPFIVAVSQSTKQRLLDAGYRAERIVVVPNGVDLAAIDAVNATVEKSDLVYAGRLMPHKRVDLLLRALALLHRAGSLLTLCIVGDGPERERLEALAAELGVRQHVTFAGHAPTAAEVFARMKAGNVMVLPSTREGFGMVVVEGWACGLPAIVCRQPLSALAELVDEPFKGRVVESQPEALANGIRELLASTVSADRQRLRNEAERYDWRQIAVQLENVLGGLTTGRAS